jgi:hypothetical protein
MLSRKALNAASAGFHETWQYMNMCLVFSSCDVVGWRASRTVTDRAAVQRCSGASVQPAVFTGRALEENAVAARYKEWTYSMDGASVQGSVCWNRTCVPPNILASICTSSPTHSCIVVALSIRRPVPSSYLQKTQGNAGRASECCTCMVIVDAGRYSPVGFSLCSKILGECPCRLWKLSVHGCPATPISIWEAH